jgi:hypothetical protein
MAFRSGFWTSNGTGDGPEAGYDQDWVRRNWHALFANGEANAGVVADYEDALIVTTTAETYTVATGFACVYGFFFENTASYDFEVVSPTGDTRIDRIVVRADWAAQTVELAVVEGKEGGTAPALTQVASDTWEIPLAQASVTTGGAITLTDEREYLGSSSGTTETSDATPLTLVLRDANARAKIGAPSAASDIARYDTVTTHAALSGSDAHGAVSAATASKIITRDANGRAQVAAPSADADIARLDTFKDLRGVYATSATSSASVASGSWGTVLTLSSIVNVATCDLLVMANLRTAGNGSDGATSYVRVVLDATTEGEAYAYPNVNGGTNCVGIHHVFEDVAAGTHSITLQAYSNRSDTTATSRRLSCIATPTGA